MATRRSVTVLVGLLAALALSCTMLFPPLDGGDGSGSPTYDITFDTPAGSRSVPTGTEVNIEWHTYTTGDAAATLDLLVRHVEDRVDTNLETGVALDSGRNQGTFTWDTTGFAAGEYKVRARILVGAEQMAQVDAIGQITLDGIPEFAFTAPESNVTLEVGGLVLIAWTARDPEEIATARIGVDSDSDHTSGNEIYIHETTLPEESEDDTFEWDGTDLDGAAVDPRTYDVFAIVDDTVNPVDVFNAGGRIVVAEEEEEEEETTVSIITPEEDVEFLTAGETLGIEYGVNQSSDTLVDLRIDTDDDHGNGNETTIVLQRLIEAETETATHEWDGNDYRGVPVDDGIYTPIVSVSSGSSTPTTAAGDGLILVRQAVASDVSGQTWERAATKWSLVESDDPPPPARRDATLAYDEARENIVMFGGRDAAGADFGDTWTWDGTNWANTGVAGPAARYDHAIAYDSERERLVLFGGLAGGARNGDTWEWDGTAWTQIAPVNSPSARSGHAMAYDAERDVVVLFGGEDAAGLSLETWTWDGTDWTLLTPTNAPSQRQAHAMAYDPSRKVVVLFGGTTPAGTAGDVWEWDGTNWTEMIPEEVEPAEGAEDQEASPGTRHSHAMVYDASRSQIAVFAGNDGTVTLNDLWLWNGTRWTDPAVGGITAARQDVGLAYDSDRRRSVAFGGAVGAPLVALLTPAAEQDIAAGDSVSISWRDDDPTSEASITLRIHNNADPAQATVTREILADREAAGDGVLDTYNWQVPQLDPGVYYVFAYITQAGAMPTDPQSVAPGRLVVPDPTQP